MKIVITGGHHNSALVIAKELKKKNYSILWLGHRFTMLGDFHDSLEYQEVTKENIKFINLLAGKFHKASIAHILRLPLGFLQSLTILMSSRPNAILCFGGYLSVPVALAGRILGISVIVFEQTASIGRANKLLSRFSLKNFVTWESSLQFFPEKTTEVIGLPLPESITKKDPQPIFKKNKPTIFFTGGKQGSNALNQTAFKLIKKLLDNYNIIHQTGSSRKTKDHNQALSLKRSLGKKGEKYNVYAHLESQQMHNALRNSDLVISRSGAHITYELIALGIPSILIPLPFSYHNEQYKNAKKVEELESAQILEQKDLNEKNLLNKISHYQKNHKAYQSAASQAKETVSLDSATKALDYIINKFPNASQKK